MTNIFKILAVSSALAFAVAPTASALTAAQISKCNKTATLIQKRQVSVKADVAKREKMLENVELAGDAWQEVESLKMLNPSYAEAAIEKEATYKDLKAEFQTFEISLQQRADQLNSEVAAYQRSCTVKK